MSYFSAGIGRTGTFIAIDYLLRQAKAESYIINLVLRSMKKYNLWPLSHFSAGIGRTGTFIAIDYLLRQAKAESHIDVFRTVTDMRYQRTNFVQTDVSFVLFLSPPSPPPPQS